MGRYKEVLCALYVHLVTTFYAAFVFSSNTLVKNRSQLPWKIDAMSFSL